MPVEVGKYAGFCYGVKAAVDTAMETLKAKSPCWALGDLIHNPQVMQRLREAGLRVVDDLEMIQPREGTVIIRSHGVSRAVYDALRSCSLDIVDATCPNVSRVHKLVDMYSRDGGDVIIAGQAGHPEVQATAGWCNGPVEFVGDAQEAAQILPRERALVVAQTTLTQGAWREIIAALEKRVGSLTVANTICGATEMRQQEAEQLAGRADVVIVVGGKKSANTRALYDTLRKCCARTYFVESAAELPREGISASDYIAITAGASTPDWSLKEVATQMNDLEKNVPQEAEEYPTAAPLSEPDAGTEAPAAQAQEPEAPVSVDVAQDAPAAAQAQEAPVAEEPAAEAAPAPSVAEPVENSFMADIEATLVTIRPGQTITGTVVQITDDEVCVNIGYKSDGLVKKNDLVEKDVKVGDEIEVEVVKVNDGEGNVLLSQRNIVNRRNWEALMAQYESNEYVQGVGKEAVKGGLIANVNGIRAFIPASQLSQRYVERIEDFVGKDMKLKIIEVDKAKKRIVCSRKAVIIEEASARKQMIWSKLVEGEVVPGIVRRLTDFGAFVDIGGVDGLVHVTDLSWGRVKHPSEVVSPNQEIMVKILSLDYDRERIQLGYKQTQPRPWDVAEEKYPAGVIVEGKVVRITTFGAFVELEPGLDGLVHISQVALTRIAKVEDAVQVGQIVRVKVLGVDSQAKRVSLSIRAALEEEAFNYSNEIPGDDMMANDMGDDYATPVDYSQYVTERPAAPAAEPAAKEVPVVEEAPAAEEASEAGEAPEQAE